MPNSQLQFVPYLSIRDAAQAVNFYSTVFEVDPHILLKMPDDRIMHCEFVFGNNRLFLSEELPEHGGSPSPATLGNTTVAIHLYVADCDRLFQAFLDAGAEILMPLSDVFWGERFGKVRDPFGHEWGISTKTKDLTPEEIQQVAMRLFEEQNPDKT